jgi:hypothetical protein
MADPVGVKHRRTQPKDRPTPIKDMLTGPDGRPLGARPQILLPDRPPRLNEPTLQLGHSPEGIVVAISNGAVELVEGREVTTTTVPWPAVQSFVVGLLGVIANHYPRGEDADGEGDG